MYLILYIFYHAYINSLCLRQILKSIFDTLPTVQSRRNFVYF